MSAKDLKFALSRTGCPPSSQTWVTYHQNQIIGTSRQSETPTACIAHCGSQACWALCTPQHEHVMWVGLTKYRSWPDLKAACPGMLAPAEHPWAPPASLCPQGLPRRLCCCSGRPRHRQLGRRKLPGCCRDRPETLHLHPHRPLTQQQICNPGHLARCCYLWAGTRHLRPQRDDDACETDE